jgi:hypothetical protein
MFQRFFALLGVLVAAAACAAGVTAPAGRSGFRQSREAGRGNRCQYQHEKTRAAAPPDEKRANRVGLILNEFTPAQGEELQISSGVVVGSVTGPALLAGIQQQGDVILAVKDTKIERVADFNRLIARLAPGSSVARLVLRRGTRLYVPLRLPT